MYISDVLSSFILVAGLLSSVQGSVESPKTLQLHGWLPSWKFSTGVSEVIQHSEYISSVSPFSYEVATSGVVIGSLPLTSKNWHAMASSSAHRKFQIIPTIAWFNGKAMDEVFRDDQKRKQHVDSIMQLVERHKFSGIDIDYEGRYGKTKPFYAKFVRELGARLHDLGLKFYCTAEARTPLEDAVYGVPLHERSSAPSTYKTLNDNCDGVRIMAYDQRDDDTRLVGDNSGMFYRPVADDAWVEKAIREALYEIDRRKLVVGIPNYGNVYLATTTASGGVKYKYVGALNYDHSIARAKQYRVKPARNSAGEMQFPYKKEGVRYWVTFPDSVSIKRKILLAEKYGLSGVSIFKFDGTMNKEMWEEIEMYTKKNEP